MLRMSACDMFQRKIASLISSTAVLVTFLLFSFSFTLLTGCGIGKIDTTVSSQPVTGAAMQGRVHGGNQPVTGATIQLYAAGVTGYGSAPAALLATPASTDPSGSFSITGQYQCPDADGDGDSQVYLVASGGNPGLAGNVNNNALVMMAALGSCNQLIANAATTFIDVNEVSTVAAAYSLAQFAVPNPSGHGIFVGTSGGNVTGLNNAMKTANNLVDLPTGAALSITPYYKAHGGTSGALLNSSYVPQARINTLANALAPCVNSNGADSNCTALFNAAKAPGGATPTDTLQAILSIAQHPGNNVAGVFGLPASLPPFQPTLSSAPNDWTLALTYSGGGMGTNLADPDPNTDPGNSGTLNSLAIDANGNVWATLQQTCLNLNTFVGVDAVVAFDNQGNPLSPASTAANKYCGGYQPKFNGSPVLRGPAALAVDLNGYIWVGNSSGQTVGKVLTRLASDGTVSQANYLAAGLPSTGVGGGPPIQFCNTVNGLAVDASNDLWAVCTNPTQGSGGISVTSTLDGSAVGQRTVGVDTSHNLGILAAVALDSNGYAWAVTSPQYPVFDPNLYQFGTTPGSTTLLPIVSDHSTSGSTFVGSVVADGPGNIYSVSGTPGVISKLPAGQTAVNNLSYPVPAGGAGAGPLAIDGAGNLWGASFTASDSTFPPVATIPSYLFQMTSSGTLLSPSGTNVYGYSGTGGGGETQPILGNSSQSGAFTGVAVDGSGNIWVANKAVPFAFFGAPIGEQLVEFIGIAPPVLTPMAQALQFGEVGVRPQAIQAPASSRK